MNPLLNFITSREFNDRAAKNITTEEEQKEIARLIFLHYPLIKSFSLRPSTTIKFLHIQDINNSSIQQNAIFLRDCVNQEEPRPEIKSLMIELDLNRTTAIILFETLAHFKVTQLTEFKAIDYL